MNEITLQDVDPTTVSLIEVNNNFAIRKNRKVSEVSVSSVSSCQSDSSEDSQTNMERKASLQEIIQKAEEKKIRSEYRRCRSLSEGAVVKSKNFEYCFELLPNLPSSVLEKMRLCGDGQRERLTEDELEQRFTSLALAFTIDAATVKDRCERQRRYRDQTETNLSMEIEKLKEKLALIQPLCTDYETVDLLSTLLTQIDTVVNAASLVTISAERFGSVQHEERLTEFVHLMINHVQMLKQQRDSARRQLQYTKRVLQNPADSPSPVSSPTNPHKSSLPLPNRKIIGRRRASIASMSQPMESKPHMDIKKVTRRISDLSLRASSLTRSIRPTRLELSGDLVKIKEGFAYEANEVDQHDETDSENENNVTENQSKIFHKEYDREEPSLDLANLSLSHKVKYRIKKIGQHVDEKYRRWINDGTIHEIFCFCALLCFSISLLAMVNILVEYEYAKRGWGSSYIFWSWTDAYDRKYSARN